MRQFTSYVKKAQLLFNNRDNLKRAAMLDVAMDFVRHNQVVGDYFEFGVYAGQTFQYAYHAAQIRGLHSMHFHALDSFEGFSTPKDQDDIGLVHEATRSCSEKQFLLNVKKAGVPQSKVTTTKGWFRDTLEGAAADKTNTALGTAKISIAWLDADLYEPSISALRFLNDRLQDGSVLIFDNWFLFKAHPERGERRAFSEWTAEHPELLVTQFHNMSWHGTSFIINLPLKHDAR